MCADPNNLPFSNQREEGFENVIAGMIGRHLRRSVRYTWWPQRRGFIRNTLEAGACDVVMGVPAGYEMARTTRPYYRSTYVLVTRADGLGALASLDDPALARARIGVHLIGDDYASVPPARALIRRGLAGNLRGYSISGDYSRPNPPAELRAAVAHGEIDAAVAWGPLAGYLASRQSDALAISPLPRADDAAWPNDYGIAMGVGTADETLHRELDRFIELRAQEILDVLRQYGVPLVER